MTLALKNTLTDPYYPLRPKEMSELRGYLPVLGKIPSSEDSSELPGNSSEDSSELPGNSSETIESLIQDLESQTDFVIESLIQDLEIEADFVIEVEDAPPKTLAEAARRLGLSGTQAATYRLNTLYKHFDSELLKNGRQLTALGWKLMQATPNKSVDELWAEYQETIVAEDPPEPEIVEAEVMDPAEVAGTLALRASAIISTIEDAEIPMFDFRQNYDGMMAVAAAIGEKAGQQMAMVQLNSMIAAYQSTLTQAQLAGVK